VELLRIEIDNCLSDRLVEHLEVHLDAKFRGEFEALDIVTDIQAAHARPPSALRPTTVCT